MYVSETRRIRETESLLREYFRRQTIPSVRDILGYLRYLDERYDFDKPFLRAPGDDEVDYNEEGSATKYNNTMTSVQGDLDVAFRNALDTADEGDTFFNSLWTKLNFILSRACKAESKINALLSMSTYSDGYFNVFEDSFQSLDYIDTSSTTCDVDIESSSVTISKDATTSGPGSLTTRYFPKIDSIARAEFRVIDRANLVSNTVVGQNYLSNIFDDMSRPWQQTIITNKAVSLTTSLLIDLGESVELSKLVLHKSFPADRGTATTSFLYSVDGVEFYSLGSSGETTLNQTTTVIFTPTTLRYIKIFITKYYPDKLEGSNYIYSVGLSLIEFHKISYSSDASGFLVSNSITVPSADGESTYDIRSVSIDVCETTDDYNHINYYISFDGGSTFHQISPSSSETSTYPKVINVADTVKSTYEEVSLVSAASLFPAILAASVYLYEGKEDRNNTPLGIIPATGGQLDASEAIAEKIELYRNVGCPGDYDSTCYKFEEKSIPAGWTFDGVYYKTILTIDDADTLIVDFGSSPAYINGVQTTGAYKFTSGNWEVKISPANFQELSGASTVLSIQTINEDGTFIDSDATVLTDPLFPYNHRLLIEGLPYSENVSGTVLYRGGKLFSGYYCKYVSSFDFVRNTEDNDYRKFSVVSGTYNNTPIIYIVVKQADDILIDQDRTKEKYTAIITATDSEKYSASSAVFKAELLSTNESTPVLTGYRLKFGVDK